MRFPGVTPQECRAAHGPLHPAVTSPHVDVVDVAVFVVFDVCCSRSLLVLHGCQLIARAALFACFSCFSRHILADT